MTQPAELDPQQCFNALHLAASVHASKHSDLTNCVAVAPMMVVFNSLRHQAVLAGRELSTDVEYYAFTAIPIRDTQLPVIGFILPGEHPNFSKVDGCVTLWELPIPPNNPYLNKGPQPDDETAFESILWGCEMDDWLMSIYPALDRAIESQTPLTSLPIYDN